MGKNTFDPKTDIPSLAGRVYIVTGGTAGIGFGIVAHLLSHAPEKIYILSQKEGHAEEAIEELKGHGDVDKVEWVQCNFADLKGTAQVAKSLRQRLEAAGEGKARLDGLVCNAGIGVGKYWETKDGIENHFQINILSQLILAMTLLPLLLQTSTSTINPTSTSRLVLMSSDLHRAAPPSTKFASLDEINTDIGPMLLYNRSKLAQVLTVRRLHADIAKGVYGPGKVYVNATHPGAVNTDQQEQAVEAYGTLGKLGVKATRPFMKDPVESGCRSGLFAVAGEGIVEDDVNGGYIVPDCKVMEPSSQALDEGLADRLWVLQERLLRDRFDGKLPWEQAK